MLYQKIYKNKKSVFLKNKYIIIGFILTVYIFAGTFFKGQEIIRYITKPVWYLESKIIYSTKSLLSHFYSKKFLLNENNNLKIEKENLNAKFLEFSALKKENDELKKILGREDKREFILGTILIKPNKSLYDTLLVDIGGDDGILPGNVVFANGEIEIGIVSSVYKKSSVVTLYSSPKYKSSVIYPDKNITIDLEGTGSGGFYFVIPRDMYIEEGTVLSSISLTPYPVAIVGKIVSSARDSFKKVLAESPVNIQELRFVQIEKN